MARIVLTLFLLLGVVLRTARGAEPASADAEVRRQAAIAEFTRKMQAANYPALFDAAAREFNVPADVLKGIAFAETRWEHLTWPPGETASPENGMPRPYGIMSLWDNRYFGHSLVEAAGLLGQDIETLKQDPQQNIRGAAALLRRIYDQTPKPSGTTEADIESWRYAIRKYCGIPEQDLSAQHALEIYTFMSRGYHQFGIEWPARPVNLEPIRQETFRSVAEEEAKRRALAAGTNVEAALTSASQPSVEARKMTNPIPAKQGPANPPPAHAKPSDRETWWFIFGALAALVAIFSFSPQKGRGDSP